MIHRIEVQGQKIKAIDAFNNTIAITVDDIANVETVVSKIDWILDKSAMSSFDGISIIHLGNINHVILAESAKKSFDGISIINNSLWG